MIRPLPHPRALLAALGALAALALLAALGTPARGASVGQLQQAINAGQGQASGLAGAVRASGGRLTQLRGGIATLERRIDRLQSEIVVMRDELFTLRGQLQAARTRLTELEAFDRHAESVLASQLVNGYESDSPDLVSVVLEASGFQDLLNQLAFQSRIRHQDVSVVEQVRAARRAVSAQAIRLGAFEERQLRLTMDVVAQRDEVDRSRIELVDEELAVAHTENVQEGRLASVRGHVAALEQQLGHLRAIQAAQAAAAARAAEQASPSPAAASGLGSQVSSANGFTFPLPKSAVVPPADWSPDDGVDMAAPGGTPEFAVCSGTIVLHGIGGFGPWAPVIHCDAPLDGYSYVYYGHAGPANQLPVGTHVSAGEVMSEIGPGIVGISTGPHIEIGFCDASGDPIGPSSAGTMLALLTASY